MNAGLERRTDDEVMDVSSIINAPFQLCTLAYIVDPDLSRRSSNALHAREDRCTYTQGFLSSVALRVLEERLHLLASLCLELRTILLLLWRRSRWRASCIKKISKPGTTVLNGITYEVVQSLDPFIVCSGLSRQDM